MYIDTHSLDSRTTASFSMCESLKSSSSERDLNPIFDKDLLVSGEYFFPTSPGVRRMVEVASKLTR